MGTFALARGMLAMYVASIDCTSGRLIGGEHGSAGRRLHEGDHNKTWRFECSATITEVLAALGESASFFSAAASDCILGVSEMAYCSADITALFASLNQVANVASGIPLSCGANMTEGEDVAVDRRLADPAFLQHGAGGHGPEERGKATGKVSNITALKALMNITALQEFENKTRRRMEEDRRIAVTECVLDINQGLGALMRGCLAINAASKACKPSALTTEEARRVCAVDIAGSIGSLTFAGEYFSFASSHCAEGHVNLKGACTGDIFELATSMSSMAAVGAAITYSCNPDVEDFDEGVPPDRRLAAKESSSATVLV